MVEIEWIKFATFVWFAWIGSVTPGPNNAVALSTAVNFGLRAVAPHSLGVAIGFSSLLLAAGLGALTLLAAVPALGSALKLFGILYLCWLGLQLIRSGRVVERCVARPPRWFETAAFQYANPKAWVLAAATVGAYHGMATPPWVEQVLIVLTFAASCAFANLIWALAGMRLKRWLSVDSRLRVFNSLSGATLIATAFWLWAG
ncbi:MAG: LysE family translocator [Burkholderiaceae bacterium]|nr:LysE family translocator [Burkholderiaceae bacterium]